LSRHPPISPPFPYTTLFRSHPLEQFLRRRARRVRIRAFDLAWSQRDVVNDLAMRKQIELLKHHADFLADIAQRLFGAAVGQQLRSEEHTSELQSRFDIVCRL